MNESHKRRLWKAIGVFIVGAAGILILGYSILIPSIATWEATSFEIDSSAPHGVSIESQIRAVEKRDPHKEFLGCAMDQNMFLYAMEDTHVIIPGVDNFTLPSPFPIRVIAGTGRPGRGEREDHLNQIARKFAEQFNKEMYGYIVTH